MTVRESEREAIAAAHEDGPAPEEGAAPEDALPEDTPADGPTPEGPGGGEAAPQVASAPPPAAPPPAVVEVRGLTLRAGGRTLLEGADLLVRRGERVLLVGPSGAGKSVLLRLLTGLLDRGSDYEVEGAVALAGTSILEPTRAAERACRSVGLVFQDHALLDELTAGDNLRFARDHAVSRGAGEAARRALAFLEEHGIPGGARVRHLSGGQKQRVAIARALARDPEVVFYDEPTSALDPRSARAVAELIREASETFGKTSIVVTHDYAPFRGVATRVVLLDPETRTLRELGWDELEAIMAGAHTPPRPLPPQATRSALGNLARRAGGGVVQALEATPGALLGAVRALPLALVPWRARPRWMLRWLLHYARIVFLGSAIPYNLIAGVIAGFVATYFTYKHLPRPEISEPLILDDILPALGFSLYRIVVPVLVTLLLAGRTGAALASDFGNRVYHHQTLAMRSLGAPAGVYLGTAALWASLVGVLVVTVVAFWSAAFTSLAVFSVVQEGKLGMTPFYWSGHFWKKLGPLQLGLLGEGWQWVVGKLLCCALGVSAVAWAIGSRPKRSTADVSLGITSTVYWGTVLVLLVHFVAAFFEFTKKPL